VNDSVDDSMLDMPEAEQPDAEQVPDAKVWIFCYVWNYFFKWNMFFSDLHPRLQRCCQL